ncbi:ribosomal RNA-processing protein 8, putative [Plasmodium berghei]|uniref:Ribosomal RNA-processing protein 8 n=2 Tax=Plasmodium berghei TaxID=5821 RepID=A0A509AIW1_PLABA|nr:ribosomal RNA-processing protein 8, putative [Plasmodium berghei ANKA]CXI34876.1 ribosomal RNA-processing protein 8, putative [Plasmodium berghei]SCM21440.1 ribosomal RNA-processing protein 8, putative [Plasmodium berghei]SCO59816.1 ribosomal RNA-processing protein 8, putative [Plasmodium berghei]SCO61095.1 ribosomal RNA-processing protein 8, putative [Plasmodium berghei]VUC55419.1 ribosomal RNA-processing protein 8, putative [Plasmodium berghei ANKA]|eukprot:XP_034421232.1 ribosomal RNA-processing protein 8, putative [Plasmodium berghei ANKA]
MTKGNTKKRELSNINKKNGLISKKKIHKKNKNKSENRDYYIGNEKEDKNDNVRKDEIRKFSKNKELIANISNKNNDYLRKNKNENSSFGTPEDIANASLFRYINEYMYTNSSEIVKKKLNETKNIFNIYHSGYNKQKKKWPKNPVDIIIKYLKKNYTKDSKIADLGCGEAQIAKTFIDWSITSFDLIQYNKYVTVCNITQLPLENNSYDCFVLCLSLMNTDWPKVIYESVRCLKKGATLIIADVVSRFTNYKGFLKFMHSVGFSLHNKINLDDFFHVLFFENVKKKDKLPLVVTDKIINNTSKLLSPCIYKRR